MNIHLKRWVCDVEGCEESAREYHLNARIYDGQVVRLCMTHAKETKLYDEKAPAYHFVNDTGGLEASAVLCNGVLWQTRIDNRDLGFSVSTEPLSLDKVIGDPNEWKKHCMDYLTEVGKTGEDPFDLLKDEDLCRELRRRSAKKMLSALDPKTE